MLEDETKIWRVGGTTVVTIPGTIVKDSNFPFNLNLNESDKKSTLEPVRVNIKIVGKKLIIYKNKEDNKKWTKKN